jgi:DNA (cytosine-5)-methyltransferase 1
MGLERAGWKIVFANDFDPKKKEMHEGNWGPDPAYSTKSVFDLNADDIPTAELCWASFPCVDLSLAGNRAGLKGAYSSAYWGFHRVMQDLGPRRPPIVIVENVPGLLTTHGGDDMAAITGGLADLGYTLDILEINARHFVPQSRPRLFIVGAKDPYALPKLDSPARRTPTRTTGICTFIDAHADLPWGIAPISGSLPLPRPSLAEILERFPVDSDIWWNSVSSQKLLDQMSPKHRSAVERRREITATSFGTVYRRMRPSGYMAEVRLDGIAGCLRTARGGSSRQFVLEMGCGRIAARHMTAVEYGRLQGAPDFRIQVSDNQAIFGFGDAVCVPAVEWLARCSLDSIRSAPCSRVGQQLVLV